MAETAEQTILEIERSPIEVPLASGRDVRRVAVLFSRLSGYMVACLQALQQRYGVELLVFCRPPSAEAPFDAAHFDGIGRVCNRFAFADSEMLRAVKDFDPDALFMSGWVDRGYLNVARALRKEGVPVVAGSDAQWSGSVRQQIGRAVSPWHLRSAIDVLWVAGERQRQFAAKLGFRGARCWSGVYACDWPRFAGVHSRRRTQASHSYLYVGRYVPVKGIDVLVQAYLGYRELVRDPWPLVCAGSGAEGHMLAGRDGIVDAGFVQPDALPELFERASAFVMPSRKEPWGVVIQEAAASGLPLICSDACGAAVHLVQDGFNGFQYEAGNVDHLTSCMVRMTEASEEERVRMGERSFDLSMQFTPERWADTFFNGVRRLTPAT